jgi:hypothetical protein
MSQCETLMLDPHWESQWDIKPQDNQSKPAPSLPSWGRAMTRVPMWVFAASNGTRVVSVRPVEVEVGREGPDEDIACAAYVFSCKKLHVFASAAIYKDAEDQFHDQVVQFFLEYSEADPACLDDDAVEIQRLYKTYFRESSPSA